MDDNRRERFAIRLAGLRAEQGMSLDALGAAVGVAGETLRRYEHGLSVPRRRPLVSAIERTLEARPGELWDILRGKPGDGGTHVEDTDARLLESLLVEIHELRTAVAELRQWQSEAPGSHPGARLAVHARRAS